MSQRIVQYLEQNGINRALSVYHCGYETCIPSHSFGPAIRAHYLFHFILKGKGRYYAGGNCYSLSAGQGFLICPGQSTYYIADADEPWEYAWVGFDGYEAKILLKDCGLSDHQLIYQDADTDLAENLIRLVELFEEQPNRYAVLGQFYRTVSCMEQPQNTVRQEETYFDHAVDFVYHNYGYDIKVSDIARQVGIDRTYLYKIFMKRAQISPQRYLIQFRLNVACSLLEKTSMNMTEIAYSCGFKDAPAFYKQFKQHYFRTPAQYRKSPPSA